MIIDKKYISWREQCNFCTDSKDCVLKFKNFLQTLDSKPTYILYGYYCNKFNLNEEKYKELKLKWLNLIKMK